MKYKKRTIKRTPRSSRFEVNFGQQIIAIFQSPALLKIQIHWAQVEPITSSFIHIASGAISSGGMLLYLKYFLSSNWRVILAIVSMLEVFAELPGTHGNMTVYPTSLFPFNFFDLIAQ